MFSSIFIDRPRLAVVISLVACLIIGLVNGLLVEAFGLNALVATLAVGMLVAGVTRLYRGPIDNVTSVPEELQTWARANVAGFSVLLAFRFTVLAELICPAAEVTTVLLLIVSPPAGIVPVPVMLRPPPDPFTQPLTTVPPV